MNDTLDSQRLWWNEWNNRFLEDTRLDDQARRRGEVALSLLRSLSIPHPEILEVGCGNGWFSERLAAQGQVTGIDLADASIKEAKMRLPNSRFLAGDICSLDLPKAHFDVVVTLETFAHIPDQREFLRRLRMSLKPAGHLILTTQNRFIYDRKKPGPTAELMQKSTGIAIIRYATMNELKKIVAEQFIIHKAFTVEPAGNRGFLRLVNSAKANRIASIFIPRARLKAFKENCGLGQTIVVLAQRSESHCRVPHHF